MHADQLSGMQTTDAFAGLRPLTGEPADIDSTVGDGSDHHPPDSDDALLTPVYHEEALHTALAGLFERTNAETEGIARFAPALPIPSDAMVTLGEGGTPLIDAPTLTDEWDVEVLVKDEGANPTGGLVDREMALAVSAARASGAERVFLPTTGNGGQSAAAYAARAGLSSHSFVPSRSTFDTKAMINVHGGEMDVAGGRYPDAVAAFEAQLSELDNSTDPESHSLAPFETPYRHEGIKTLAYELATSEPDAVLVPTAHGHTALGLARGFRELHSADIVSAVPRLYVAQPTGCAPIVDALEREDRELEPIEYPDTICGALEVPDPTGGAFALAAVEATDGGGVAVEDDALLDGALDATRAGIPMSATGGVAVAGGRILADAGAFDADDRVILLNPATANRESDVLRSRLMSEGR